MANQSSHDPSKVPDLAQHYAEEIKAILDDPKTLIEYRMMPAAVGGEEHSWQGTQQGVSAIQSMLHASNYRDGYEYRIRPPGIHGYAVFTRTGSALDYLSMYKRPVAAEALGSDELCLHVELDPDDTSVIRTAEIIKPLSAEEANDT